MTAYDARAQLTAWRKLRPIADGGKGQALTLATPGPQTRDPATGIKSTAADLQTLGCGLVTAYSLSLVAQQAVAAGDLQLTLAALDVTGQIQIPPPVNGKTVVTLADGSKWRAIISSPLSPAGLPILYTVQLRQ